MTVKIGDLLLTKEHLKKDRFTLDYALHHLMKLKHPVVNPTVLNEDVNSKRVLAKELEMVFVQSAIGMQYIGTSELWECVALYLFDDETHGLIHVNRSNISIDPFISRFKDKKNVRAILVGGGIGNDNYGSAKDNIMTILGALVRSDQEFTIDSQMVMSSNQISGEGMMQYIASDIFGKAARMYRKVMDRDIPNHIIPQFSAMDFKQKHFNFTLCKDPEMKKKIALFSRVSSLMLPDDNDILWGIKKNRQLNRLFERDVVAVLDAIFSIEGYAVLMEHDFIPAETGFPALREFVFDIQTRELHVISDTRTMYGVERQLYLYDPQIKSDYFLAFDGRYHYPPMSREYLQGISRVKELIKFGDYDDETVAAIESISLCDESYHHGIFAELVLEFGTPAVANCTVCPQLFSWRESFAEAVPDTSSRVGLPFRRKSI